MRIPRMKGTAERQALPPAFMRGRATKWQGESPAAAAGTALSVTASPCQLSQGESQGSCAPFLPPAFMRGEGHEVAGGVLRRSGESLLSHGFAVPAPPEGKPRVLRTVPAPAFMRGEGHAVAGGVLRRSGDAVSVTLPDTRSFREAALPGGSPLDKSRCFVVSFYG